MTILEELIDLGLRTCESRRDIDINKDEVSRSAVVLGSNGKTYVGCDMLVPGDALPIGGEKSALLAAIADGTMTFEVYKKIF